MNSPISSSYAKYYNLQLKEHNKIKLREKSAITLMLFLAGLISVQVKAETLFSPLPAKSVVKILGLTGNDKMLMGSGVVIAPNRVATNCHVTRFAKSISVIKGSLRYQVIAQTAEPELDLCVLHCKDLTLPAVELGNVEAVQIGSAVAAYGYPNGIGLSFRQGEIKQLHPFRTSYIIEIDIGIKQGASGGGLFNQQGQLLGLTTFYRTDEGGRYYAIPAAWLKSLQGREGNAIAPLSGKPFWQMGIPFTKK